MTDNMICPKCHCLYTFQPSLGGVGCGRCHTLRPEIRKAEELVREPGQLSAVGEGNSTGSPSPEGSTPSLCVKTGGELDEKG